MAGKKRGHDFSDFNISGDARVQAGDAHTTNNHYYDSHTASKLRINSPTRQGQLARAKSTIPFAQDEHFVGREDILENLHVEFARPRTHKRISLQGLGGIGKSQIAIEFSYRYRLNNPEHWIFWVYAGTRSRFQQAYREIADALDIPGRADPKVDVLFLVRKWLADEANVDWLMIVDNADDGGLFFASNKDSLSTFIPQSLNGSVLITSRNHTGADLAGGPHNAVLVDQFDEASAVKLFTNKLPHATVDTDVLELFKMLDCIPLAINQAIAYIAKARVTPHKYVEAFSKSEENQMHLLGKPWNDIRRDAEVPHAVSTTWQLSFERVKQSSPQAADALAMLSMYDRQAIPQVLVFHKCLDDLEYYEAIGVLLEYALLQRESNDSIIYSMHRLVQVCTRAWLKADSTLQIWERKALASASEIFPVPSYDNVSQCEMILPHARKVLDYEAVAEDLEAIMARQRVLILVSEYLGGQGQQSEAYALASSALERAKKYFGLDDLNTFDAMLCLAPYLAGEGKYEEAEIICRKALAGYKTRLGPDSQRTFCMMGQLGTLLCRRERYFEADELLTMTVEGMEGSQDANGSILHSALLRLGGLRSAQESYIEAEQLYKRALNESRKRFGFSHPEYLATVDTLAKLYTKLGRQKDSARLHKQVLYMRDRILGREHPETLMSVCALAELLFAAKEYEEAEELYQRAVTVFEKQVGPNHLRTLLVVESLAEIYEIQRKYTDAMPLRMRALSIAIARNSRSHTSTIQAAETLADLYEVLERYADAACLWKENLVITQRKLGAAQCRTISALSRLKQSYLDQGQLTDAVPLSNRIMLWEGLLLFLMQRACQGLSNA